MAQSATDLGCAPEDFIKDKNIIVESTTDPNARKYLKLPFICDLVSYGNNIVASVDMKYKDIVEQYINRFAPEHCFETPNMHILNDAFQAHGMLVCFMAEYFLPRMESLQELPCRYELKVATVYKGNIIKNLIMDCQSYTKYRPNETTGGIFVSWRRKEELPTGA